VRAEGAEVRTAKGWARTVAAEEPPWKTSAPTRGPRVAAVQLTWPADRPSLPTDQGAALCRRQCDRPPLMVRETGHRQRRPPPPATAAAAAGRGRGRCRPHRGPAGRSPTGRRPPRHRSPAGCSPAPDQPQPAHRTPPPRAAGIARRPPGGQHAAVPLLDPPPLRGRAAPRPLRACGPSARKTGLVSGVPSPRTGMGASLPPCGGSGASLPPRLRSTSASPFVASVLLAPPGQGRPSCGVPPPGPRPCPGSAPVLGLPASAGYTCGPPCPHLQATPPAAGLRPPPSRLRRPAPCGGGSGPPGRPPAAARWPWRAAGRGGRPSGRPLAAARWPWRAAGRGGRPSGRPLAAARWPWRAAGRGGRPSGRPHAASAPAGRQRRRPMVPPTAAASPPKSARRPPGNPTGRPARRPPRRPVCPRDPRQLQGRPRRQNPRRSQRNPRRRQPKKGRRQA
jgi:hypothetical protein